MNKDNITILVLEDDVSASKLLVYTLESAGFQVVTGETGYEGLQLLKKQAFDLVVCDVMMPEMDGFELREQIESIPHLQEIPFIFLTAKVQIADQERGLKMGIDDYMMKPYDPNILLARVENILERYSRIKRVANTDSLTGLKNRRSFESEVQRELDRIKRYDGSGSLVFLDIDNFKSINDSHGHFVGDKVLISLSDVLKKYTRSTDLICRAGGEEFLIYLPNTNGEVARSVVENLLRKFRAKKVEFLASEVTFTAGVSEVTSEISEYSELVKIADQAMYRAKGAGKARVLHVDDYNGNVETGIIPPQDNLIAPVIFIVEDEIRVSKLITHSLKDTGYNLVFAADSETAIEKIFIEQPNLIVLDLMISGNAGDGIAVLEVIQKNSELCKIPVIVLSEITSISTTDSSDMQKKLGVEKYIEKPFDPEVLLESIKTALDRMLEEPEQMSKG